MKLSAYKTDRKREIEGRWVSGSRGGQYRVARISNPKYKAYRDRLLKPHRRSIDADSMDPEKLRELLARAVARHILLDWKDVEDDDGKPIVYTSQVGEQALIEVPDLYDEILRHADNFEDFALEQQEADAETLGND